MANTDMKLLSVQVPVVLYDAIREWARNRDLDVSKAVRQALRDFCRKEGIETSDNNGSKGQLAEEFERYGFCVVDLE